MNEITDLIVQEKDDSLIESPYNYSQRPVARVTHILSAMLHEDYLMTWSNAIGLYQHKKYEDELNMAAEKGTLVHEAINHYLMTGETPEVNNMGLLSLEYKRTLRNGFGSFYKWWRDNKKHLVLVATEMEIVCPLFAGTCDLIVNINGKTILMDFKTSKQTGYKHFLQLSAYRYILEKYYDYSIDGVGILLLDKSRVKYTDYILDLSIEQNRIFLDQAEHTFLALAYAYYNRLKTQDMYKKIFP